MLAFYFKLFPEIIEDGRVFIAEPPLYRVNDKKNPFVINKNDYLDRYIRLASKDYKLGYQPTENENEIEWFDKNQWREFLTDTANYVEDMMTLVNHYKINDRLLEMIMEEFAMMNFDPNKYRFRDMVNGIDIQHLMNRICTEFIELYYDDNDHVIKGALNGKYQMIEIGEQLVQKTWPMIELLKRFISNNGILVLKDVKTGTEYRLSLLETLKMLKKYQPDILHRFKGLGENDDKDIKLTVMDPNTRTLIRVNIGDIENDMKIFQMLRGTSPQDALARKLMMQEFRIDKSQIDT